MIFLPIVPRIHDRFAAPSYFPFASFYSVSYLQSSSHSPTHTNQPPTHRAQLHAADHLLFPSGFLMCITTQILHIHLRYTS
jgi:hypothetical protein